MSRIQARAVELEWRAYRDADTYHPLRDGRAKDNWAAARLLAAGEIEPAEFEAAKTYALWLQRAIGGGGGDTSYDRVDGSMSDPHARMLDVVICAQKAESARQFVLSHCAPTRLKTRKRTMEELFRYPHMSFQQMREVTDESAMATKRRIKACLSLLRIYLDGVDSDRKNWAGAVDKFPEQREPQI